MIARYLWRGIWGLLGVIGLAGTIDDAKKWQQWGVPGMVADFLASPLGPWLLVVVAIGLAWWHEDIQAIVDKLKRDDELITLGIHRVERGISSTSESITGASPRGVQLAQNRPVAAATTLLKIDPHPTSPSVKVLMVCVKSLSDQPVFGISIYLDSMENWNGQRFTRNSKEINPILLKHIRVLDPEFGEVVHMADCSSDHAMEIVGPQGGVSITQSGWTRRATVRASCADGSAISTFCFLWNAGSGPQLVEDPSTLEISINQCYSSISPRQVAVHYSVDSNRDRVRGFKLRFVAIKIWRETLRIPRFVECQRSSQRDWPPTGTDLVAGALSSAGILVSPGPNSAFGIAGEVHPFESSQGTYEMSLELQAEGRNLGVHVVRFGFDPRVGFTQPNPRVSPAPLQ